MKKYWMQDYSMNFTPTLNKMKIYKINNLEFYYSGSLWILYQMFSLHILQCCIVNSKQEPKNLNLMMGLEKFRNVLEYSTLPS